MSRKIKNVRANNIKFCIEQVQEGYSEAEIQEVLADGVAVSHKVITK